MKKKIISLFASALLVVAFFTAITLVLAENGKIDSTSIPVVGSIITKVKGGNATVSSQKAERVTASEKYTSISSLSVSGEYIYAADTTGKKVYKLTKDGEAQKIFDASMQVNAVKASENCVYVLCGAENGRLVALSTDLEQKWAVSVGHTPSDIAIKDGKAYIADRFDNSISVVDLEANTVISSIAIDGREPIALALAGDKLYVACHLPNDVANGTLVSADVVVIDTNTDTEQTVINLVNGAGGVKDITATADGSTVYVSHVIARYAYPTTQLDRGWINTNGFSIINTADNSAVAVMLDEVELGAANPWGIALSDDEKALVVALSGNDEVMLVDIDKMNEKITAVRAGNGVVATIDKIVDYLPFLDGCRTRISLGGKGARAVATAEGKAYIGQYFTGDIAELNLADKSVKSLSFVTQPENDDVREGEILFSDANMCYQKWQSCLSCHPDARVDGLNWDNLNDGLGNAKSAKSMLYSHRTPPVMITGIRADAETAVRAGMKYIQFNVLEEEKMAKIDAYLKSLTPVQSPYLNEDGTLTESAERGKELFESEGCATCHPAPLYTDLKTHDVGTNGAENWEDRAYDTPSLVEAWRTGAWLHDGRYNSMTDVVKHFAPDLSQSEIEDLADFVLSIGDEGEQYGVEQVYSVIGEKTSICKLTEGSKIEGLTIRCQQEDAIDTVYVTVELKDGSGKVLKESTHTIKNLAFGYTKYIKLNSVYMPKENLEGTTFTVKIYDKDGKAVASDYVLKY